MKDDEWTHRRIELWAVGLCQLEITQQQFELARVKSFALDWPSTAAADFYALSQPNLDVDYTDGLTAYRKAANGDYVNAASALAANEVGLWSLRYNVEDVTKPVFLAAYKKYCLEHASNSVKFNQKVAQVRFYSENDTKVLEPPVKLSQEQIRANLDIINNIRKSL